MNIYFAGSIRGGKPNREWFQQLIKHIQHYGRVMTEHSFDYSYKEEIAQDDTQIYKTDINWLKESHALIAEITAPSLGVGYEIAKAETWRKPILLLYRYTPNKKPSAMLNGNKNLLVKTYYKEKEAFEAIDIFLSELNPNP